MCGARRCTFPWPAALLPRNIPRTDMISPIHHLALSRAGRKLLGLTLVVALGACTNLHDDRQRTQTEGALAGAAGGAVLGTAAGAALGGKDKKKAMLAGAAAGAVVGGLAGAAHGEAVARKKAGYAQTEDALGARLSAAKKQLADRRVLAHEEVKRVDLGQGKT